MHIGFKIHIRFFSIYGCHLHQVGMQIETGMFAKYLNDKV